MDKGTLVQVTAEGRQGTLLTPSSRGFAAPTVAKGDRGEYAGPHPTLPDWHLIQFEIDGETLYCPLPEDAFAEWRPNPRSDPGTNSLAALLP